MGESRCVKKMHLLTKQSRWLVDLLAAALATEHL